MYITIYTHKTQQKCREADLPEWLMLHIHVKQEWPEGPVSSQMWLSPAEAHDPETD